jgi:hypothetical protein
MQFIEREIRKSAASTGRRNSDMRRDRLNGNRKRRTEMSAIQTEIATLGGVVWTVLTHLKNGEINDAAAYFGEKFEFKDQGIGLVQGQRAVSTIFPESQGTLPRFFVAD